MIDRHKLEMSLYLFKSVFFRKTLKQYSNNDYPYIFDEAEVCDLLIDEFPKYNNQQLKLHINKYVDSYVEEKDDLKRYCKPNDKNNLDIYDVIFDFADTMIMCIDERFCFKYEYADIWRSLTREIDEEIFVIAAAVRIDLRRQIDMPRKMDWAYCIEHNNHEIKMMLQRDSGVSENHMHLRCSSPYFYLSWIYLMNDIDNMKYYDIINEIDKSKLMEYTHEGKEYSLALIRFKATAIRLLLYYIILCQELNHQLYEGEEPYKSLYSIVNEVIHYESNTLSTFPINKIHRYIFMFRDFKGIDYAQKLSASTNNLYNSLSGERSIIYYSFKIIYEKKNGYEFIEKLLFLYLQMKQKFRTEIVQSNNRLGFYNFAEYEGRKNYFIPWSEDVEECMATDAICSICDNMKLYRVELRISPKLTWNDNKNAIEMYDKAIQNALKIVHTKHRMNFKRNFFYTLHFPKRNDNFIKGCCRHFELREDIRKKARALVDFRNHTDYNTASRVLGIDACSSEIDCRPEVFGPAFRYLQDFESNSTGIDKKKLRQLKSTYHVAEDNYDLLDALRAIYEAVFFLSLRSGSRLGHSTLLGVSVNKYYKYNNPISMPSQVFLDNIVWLYYFISENGIIVDDNALLTTYLQKQFEIYFHKIFVDDLQSCFVEDVLEKAQWSSFLKFPNGRENCSKENCEFNIYHYYLSYLLRGDEPELYKEGFINNKCKYSDEYKICNTYSIMSKARRNFEANYLYYLYHYSERVKERGQEPTEEFLPDYVIHAISLVQEKMKKLVSDQGICIETNPTSNVFISIIDDYSEHPISNFYDHSLSKNKNNIQLNISINTDDKSTFSTCLSNEYAYLLYYLEHKKDEKNNYVYSRFEIMQWLDEIRKMGNDQSFAN